MVDDDADDRNRKAIPQETGDQGSETLPTLLFLVDVVRKNPSRPRDWPTPLVRPRPTGGLGVDLGRAVRG
ncbi:hypothetical protein VTN02DRAFT_2559 [Thermoascus thermophilus]